MLKTTENNTTSNREFSCSKYSVREKLRAKIRQRIHKLPSEVGDENVNTLNQTKLTRTRHERCKPTSLQDDKVRVFPSRVSFASLY